MKPGGCLMKTGSCNSPWRIVFETSSCLMDQSLICCCNVKNHSDCCSTYDGTKRLQVINPLFLIKPFSHQSWFHAGSGAWAWGIFWGGVYGIGRALGIWTVPFFGTVVVIVCHVFNRELWYWGNNDWYCCLNGKQLSSKVYINFSCWREETYVAFVLSIVSDELNTHWSDLGSNFWSARGLRHG